MASTHELLAASPIGRLTDATRLTLADDVIFALLVGIMIDRIP